MVDLTDMTFDPDFSTCLTIYRSTGSWAAGGWKEKITQIPASGVVTIVDPETLAQVPEGDRIKGSIMFVTSTAIYETLADRPADGGGGTSDEIRWNGQKYRVAYVSPWAEMAGFWAAVLVRTKGD